MGLEIYLKKRRWVSYDNGKTFTRDDEEIEDLNLYITHNLNKMAEKAGLYKVLWHPEEYFNKEEVFVKDILPLLEDGFNKLVANPDYYKKYNADNGWGTYDELVRFLKKYIEYCKMFLEEEVIIYVCK